MDDSTTSRRTVLKSTAALATIGTLAGCSGGGGTTTAGGDGGDGSDGDDGGDGGTQMPSGSAGQGQRVSAVPASANMLVYLDYEQFRTDEDLKRLLDTGVQSGTGAQGVEGALESQGLGDAIDPAKVYDMMLFAEIPEDDPMAGASSNGGAIFWTGLPAGDAVPAMKTAASENGTELTEETYSGKTMLMSESGTGSIGVVSEGVYVVGTDQVIRDTIDVATGSGESASGAVTDALANTKDAPVRFAADLPTGTFSSGDGTSGGTGAMQYTSKIDVVSGGLFYKNGSEVGFRLNATMTDEQSATEATQMLKQFKTVYSQQADQMEQGGEELKRILGNLSISQSGKTVSASYEDTVDNLIQLGQGGLPMGGGMGS